jgi:hypothetical protein
MFLGSSRCFSVVVLCPLNLNPLLFMLLGSSRCSCMSSWKAKDDLVRRRVRKKEMITRRFCKGGMVRRRVCHDIHKWFRLGFLLPALNTIQLGSLGVPYALFNPAIHDRFASSVVIHGTRYVFEKVGARICFPQPHHLLLNLCPELTGRMRGGILKSQLGPSLCFLAA